MLAPKAAIDWIDALVWFGVIAVAGFLVSWVLTEVLRVRRSLYVGALAIVTGGLTAGYLAWSRVGATFWTHNWAWGLLGAAVTGAFLALQIRRVRVPEVTGRELGAAVGVWEGAVYGVAEGLLLSVLPVVIVWQAFAAQGWTRGWLGVGAGAASLAASAVVIVVHHMGYREDRSRRMAGPLMACLVLSLGYLLTASPISAAGGHVVLHLAMLGRGMELPPHRHEPAGTHPRMGVSSS
jgi:hypothetical protein